MKIIFALLTIKGGKKRRCQVKTMPKTNWASSIFKYSNFCLLAAVAQSDSLPEFQNYFKLIVSLLSSIIFVYITLGKGALNYKLLFSESHVTQLID
jgi:hypothetical protein